MSRHSNGVSKLHGEVSRRPLERCLDRRARSRGPDHQHNQRDSYQNLAGSGISPNSTTSISAIGKRHLTNEDFWRRVIDIPDAQSLGHAPEVKVAPGASSYVIASRRNANAWANRPSPSAPPIAFSIRKFSPSVSRGVSRPTNAARCCSPIRTPPQIAQRYPPDRYNSFSPANRIRATKAARRSSRKFTNITRIRVS